MAAGDQELSMDPFALWSSPSTPKDAVAPAEAEQLLRGRFRFLLLPPRRMPPGQQNNNSRTALFQTFFKTPRDNGIQTRGIIGSHPQEDFPSSP